jgi:hypothetical protein
MTLAATEFLAALASMCCPEGSSASATSAISPVPIVLRCSRSRDFNSLARLNPICL